MGKRFVIIGSNCFTGSHIVDALVRNPQDRVFGLSRSPEYKALYLPYKSQTSGNFHFRQVDYVRNFQECLRIIDDISPHVVINVAALSEVALSNERPEEYFETNTLGVVRLCNALRTRKYLEHYVHISSAEIFGSCDAPAHEGTLFNPSTPYAVSKAAADMYLHSIIKNYTFPAILIRSTNVYGKHQQLFKIIPRTAIFVKMERPIELHGGGRAVKSFIHIRDVVKGLQLALEKGEPGSYHFSVPSEQTVAEIVRIVVERMGADFEQATRVVEERLGQDARYTLDCRKAHDRLGWQPEVRFEDGVDEVIRWIEDNWDTIRNEPLHYIHKV